MQIQGHQHSKDEEYQGTIDKKNTSQVKDEEKVDWISGDSIYALCNKLTVVFFKVPYSPGISQSDPGRGKNYEPQTYQYHPDKSSLYWINQSKRKGWGQELSLRINDTGDHYNKPCSYSRNQANRQDAPYLIAIDGDHYSPDSIMPA